MTPSSTIGFPSTTTCRTSVALAAKTTDSSRGLRVRPGEADAVQADGHEVGARARLDPAGVGPPEAGVAPGGRRAQQLDRAVVPRSPVASRSSSSTARASSNGSMTACESLPNASRTRRVDQPPHPADAVGEVALGRRAHAAVRARAAEEADVRSVR